MTKTNNVNKLDSLVLLRGLAVLGVCFCHFAKPLSEGFIFSEIFKTINYLGRYGVEMFFVISGFVIPLSFDRGKYKITDYFVFLYKRMIRLHPTYLAAIALTLIITYFSFRNNSDAFPDRLQDILKSILLFDNLSFNIVFWTLFIEAQYYLFIGLFYIILKNYPKISFFIIIPLLLIASQLPIANHIKLLKHLDFFLIGTIGYFIYIDHGQRILNYGMLILLIVFSFIFCSIPNVVESVPAAFASLFTILMILYYNGAVPKIPKFLGKISYSLYLTHFPVGTKFVRLLMKIINPTYAWTLFFLAFIVTIPIAWLFNKYLEEPTLSMSKKIRYKSHLKDSAAL